MSSRSGFLMIPALAALTLGTSALAGDCSGDVTGDCQVNVTDLLAVLADWGPCPGCPTDINGDGDVGVNDLLVVLAEWGPCPGAGIVDTDLAGGPLAEYPYFEYVRAFNKASTGLPVVDLSVAIDPTRFPGIVGATADIYIVDAKSMAEWNGDPSLTDARGAPQTETFVAGTIQDNTFAVSNSTALSTASTVNFGRPYDVVIDINRNGTLDCSDYIDGRRQGADTNEHGFYTVHDIASPGPLAVIESAPYQVGTVFGIVSTRTTEEVYYPADIASMGELPLIVVSHGNGHQYYWYDHIGYHMASYGYVVMSHQNNTGPGIQTASITTLGHTDAFLDQLDTIQGGVLEGHVDSSNIIWIGHSRGGEGVARAYDRMHDDGYVTYNYSIDDIKLISSIAPTDFLNATGAHPHDAKYHLWTGAADADVNGCANCNICQTFHLHDRATSYRTSIYLHGAGHGVFHAGTGSFVATGPCLIDRTVTHSIMRGYFLALVENMVFGNVPGKDYLTRQYESFHALGSSEVACAKVDFMYLDDPVTHGNYMLDDYQTNPSTAQSSSGGAVTFDVLAVSEGRADDNNTTFTHTTSDPMNGTTLANAADLSKLVVFEYSASDRYYELEVPAGARDLTGYRYLSFRGAQSTRHPLTIARMGDLTFDVTLRDGDGTTSTINIGAYGGGLEELYQRTGCGTGAGWSNEFETVRLGIFDYLNNGSGLDLTDIVAVRFEFGPSHGDAQGRISLDEIQFTID